MNQRFSLGIFLICSVNANISSFFVGGSALRIVVALESVMLLVSIFIRSAARAALLRRSSHV